MDRIHHKILIIGGGAAGVAVAARLRRAKQDDVALLEPSDTHYYQPLWTLVGAGCASAHTTKRAEAKVLPRGVAWIKDAADEIDPENQVVTTRTGIHIHYDLLVVAPGIQLDWDKIPGLTPTLGKNGVSSNYRFDLAPKTWEAIQNTKSGRALFTMPSGPIKCAGAPQKIAYMAADYWQRQGLLDNIEVTLVIPTPTIFGIPEFARVLEAVIERYGIQMRYQHELVEIDPDKKEAVLIDQSQDGRKERLSYDFMHAVPPQSAPDWIKDSPLAAPNDPKGYIDIDKHTLQHTRWPNVFALGDAGNSPNSKTGAAARKQAPVVVKNLLAQINGDNLTGSYNGYASCPIVTAKGKMLLAEFDYSMQPTPTIPLINTQKERRDMWLLKKYGLPFMYWNFILRGLA